MESPFSAQRPLALKTAAGVLDGVDEFRFVLADDQQWSDLAGELELLENLELNRGILTFFDSSLRVCL